MCVCLYVSCGPVQATLTADHRCAQAGAAADKAAAEAEAAHAAAREEARRRGAAERKAAETTEALRAVRQVCAAGLPRVRVSWCACVLGCLGPTYSRAKLSPKFFRQTYPTGRIPLTRHHLSPRESMQHLPVHHCLRLA